MPATMRRNVVLLVMAFGLLLPGALSCRRERDTTSAFPRDQTLYYGGWQWGEPSTFNPLAGAPSWPVRMMNLLYEPLLVFNADRGQMQPLLAESHSVSEGAIEVTLQAEARWSDGRPVTGWDVKYTFELGQRFSSLRTAAFWPYLTAVKLPEEASGSLPPEAYPRRVVLELNPQRLNPLVVLDALQETPILPKHVVAPLLAKAGNDIHEFLKLKLDERPVVSGPYTLHSYGSEKIVAVRREDYWGNQVFFDGKQPAPKYIIHPIYKSNDHYSIALQQGRLDVSSCFVPRIWLKQKKGVRSWYEQEPFFVSGSIPVFVVNVLRSPLNDVHYRRAMAFALNYRDIRELAVSGYSTPLKPGLILPFGSEGALYSASDGQKYGASRHDPERARAELRAGGYRPVWSDDQKLLETRDAQGRKVPTVYIKSPNGWTDWESIVRIAVRSMRAVGIDARERLIEGGLYFAAVHRGDFDLILYQAYPARTPSRPWSRFEAFLTSREWAPEGRKAYKNMGRFNNPNSPGYIPRFDQLLDRIPTLKDEQGRIQAYRELNILFMQQQPVLPVVYRPDPFYEFSVRVWEGFPTSKHPYLPPEIPGYRLGTRILWHLRLANAQ